MTTELGLSLVCVVGQHMLLTRLSFLCLTSHMHRPWVQQVGNERSDFWVEMCVCTGTRVKRRRQGVSRT